MLTTLKIEVEEEEIMARGAKVELEEGSTNMLNPMHSIKGIHNSHKANLMVSSLSARFVARLDTKPWIATIEWILHIKEGIHLPNLQQ